MLGISEDADKEREYMLLRCGVVSGLEGNIGGARCGWPSGAKQSKDRAAS
jgi:hypothetical protein